MPEVEPLAVLAATAAAFVLSSTWYTVFAAPLASVSEAAARAGQPPPWKLGVEVLRSVVLATIVAGLAARGKIDGWAGGLCLGLALWVGFPLVLWTGALIWERTPAKLAAIHAGDWLAKLLAVALIVCILQ